MEDLQKQLGKLQQAIQAAVSALHLKEAENQLQELQVKAQATDFWTDRAHAQEVMKQQAKLEAKIKPWRELEQAANEALELVKFGDVSLQADLQTQFAKLESDFSALKQQLQFGGAYDDHDAIISIHAGAGGTDAQDWAAMLLRMYVRWAEQGKYRVRSIEETAGEEAGVKSATCEIDGNFAYGKLKGEHGVHRLVRLSPFNADHLRQTSFAKVEVLPKIEKTDTLELDEKDFKIDVFRSGGHGGQSVNTTDSAVRITHMPTGITVAIQNERSQLQNKETALTILRSRLAQLQLEQHKEKLAELKGPNQSAEWGNQIRSYVLHPYKQVKDLRTKYETSDAEGVLNGNLDGFITAYLEQAPTE